METGTREKIISKVVTVAFIVLLFAVILYGVLGEVLLPSEIESNGEYFQEYTYGWYQVLEDGSRELVELPGRLKLEGEEVVMEHVLPLMIYDDAYMIFRTSKQDYRVYVDGELRKEYSTKDSRIWGMTSPTSYVFVKIGAKDAGKTIQVHTTGIESKRGNLSYVYYANFGGFWTVMLREQGMTLLLAVIMLVFGLLAAAVSFSLQVIYKRTQRLLSLSVGVIVVAFWMIGNSMFRQLIFSNISVISDLTFLMVALLPAPFAIYMNQRQSRRYTVFYHIGEILALCNTVLCSCLYIAGVKDFVETFNWMAMVLFYTIVVIILSMIMDVVKGYIKEYWLTAVAIVLAAIAAIAQVINYLSFDKAFNISIAAFGLVLMLIVAVLDTIRDMAAMEKDRQRAIVASDTKSKFLANMSHEIRTPINAILGMNEMILSETTEESVRAYAKDVDNSGRMLIALVNDVLDFSKIESGMMELVEQEYDIRLLVDRVMIMAKNRSKDKGLDFELKIGDKLPATLYGDEGRIQQILANFLTNSVKYTDQGSIILSLDYETDSHDSNGNLIISVADTGRGIKEEDQGKLFQAFQRVDEKKSVGIEGTGLGLAITKSFVDLMKGTINVDSEYGKGTTFTVSIPQKMVGTELAKDRETQIVNENKTMEEQAFYANNLRILVADDVPMNLKVFTAFLKGTGITVDAVGSGKEAIEAWNKNAYDLVFLDHMMPEMDGIECAKILWQKKAYNENTPVIMLTANAIVGMKEEYFKEGFSDYMTKPFAKGALLEMIQKHTDANKWNLAEKSELGLEENETVKKIDVTENNNTTTSENQEESENDHTVVIDRELGIGYCGGDEEFYEEILQEYIEADKKSMLDKHFEEQDWENYRIQIHALKSTSLTIGATVLSEHAKSLEMAAKEGNIAYILEQHESVMREYCECKEYIKNN